MSSPDKKPAARCNESRKRSRDDEDPFSEPSAVTKLIQCLPREELEHLISSSVEKEMPLTVGDLIKSLPEGQQWKAKRKSKAKIGEGQSRVGTGSFDCVDDAVMCNIFGYLPLQDRIVCCTKVCKPWKNYKNLAGLWDDLTAFRPRSKQNAVTCKSGRCRLHLFESSGDLCILNSHWFVTMQICTPNGS